LIALMVVLTPAISGRAPRLGDDLLGDVGEPRIVAAALLLYPRFEAGGDAEPRDRGRVDRAVADAGVE